MLLFKSFIIVGLLALGALSVEAADMEVQVVDKNCWIEVFDDTKYDADDPHVKVQGPKEYASLKNLNGKNWNDDIQSVIVGSDATVLASYAGTYRSEQIPIEVKMSVKEGVLSLQPVGQGELAMKALSPTHFVHAPSQLDVEFEGADSFTLKTGGGTFKFKKGAAK